MRAPNNIFEKRLTEQLFCPSKKQQAKAMIPMPRAPGINATRFIKSAILVTPALLLLTQIAMNNQFKQ